MYIVAIGWIYVVLLMSLTETSFGAGLATFVFYGLLPLSVLGYLMDGPGRRRRRARAAQTGQAPMQEQDRTPLQDPASSA
ncbi:MAG: hypothetical protein J0H09_20845, partial [Burkholderiales bacterium]|nr:hypothetical protein [Burkholderiales bacterium]